jgi:hypothetical protein
MPKHCCEAMDKALSDGYLERRLTVTDNSLAELPPVIPGPLLKPRGHKHKPVFIINICPWCGHEYNKVKALR